MWIYHTGLIIVSFDQYEQMLVDEVNRYRDSSSTFWRVIRNSATLLRNVFEVTSGDRCDGILCRMLRK
jgi:hypothetical protein